jgi:hypothetical protein
MLLISYIPSLPPITIAVHHRHSLDIVTKGGRYDPTLSENETKSDGKQFCAYRFLKAPFQRKRT